MKNLTIEDRNITDLFVRMDEIGIDEIYISTNKSTNSLTTQAEWLSHWEQVVEMGVKSVVTEPFEHEFSLVKYEDVTMVLIRYHACEKIAGVYGEANAQIEEILINH